MEDERGRFRSSSFNIIMGKGFTRKSNTGIAVKEFVALSNHVQEYIDSGYFEQVQEVLQNARTEIRDWIRLNHPNPVFTDKNVQTYGGKQSVNSRGRVYYADLSQFRLGHFGMVGKNGQSAGHAYNGAISSLNVYSDYYARWWATGSKGHKTSKGMAKGYPSHGDYYGASQNVIGDRFTAIVEEELQKVIKI